MASKKSFSFPPPASGTQAIQPLPYGKNAIAALIPCQVCNMPGAGAGGICSACAGSMGAGAPGISTFGSAVQVWAIAQQRDVSVADVARAFNIAPERVVEAIEEHYWMDLDGSAGDHEHVIIQNEGE